MRQDRGRLLSPPTPQGPLTPGFLQNSFEKRQEAAGRSSKKVLCKSSNCFDHWRTGIAFWGLQKSSASSAGFGVKQLRTDQFSMTINEEFKNHKQLADRLLTYPYSAIPHLAHSTEMSYAYCISLPYQPDNNNMYIWGVLYLLTVTKSV